MDSFTRERKLKNPLERAETFIKTIEELKSEVVIVEGKKDVLALKGLGIIRVIAINGMPLAEFASKRLEGHKEVVILTDFDEKGMFLHSKLKEILRRRGIMTNDTLRSKVMRFKKNQIEDFKGLNPVPWPIGPQFLATL